jgi:translation initiation factor 5B
MWVTWLAWDAAVQISRESIDIVKETFREDMSKEDWALIVKLKKVFKIQ